jgi:hypothetical protein
MHSLSLGSMDRTILYYVPPTLSPCSAPDQPHLQNPDLQHAQSCATASAHTAPHLPFPPVEHQHSTTVCIIQQLLRIRGRVTTKGSCSTTPTSGACTCGANLTQVQTQKAHTGASKLSVNTLPADCAMTNGHCTMFSIGSGPVSDNAELRNSSAHARLQPVQRAEVKSGANNNNRPYLQPQSVVCPALLPAWPHVPGVHASR